MLHRWRRAFNRIPTLVFRRIRFKRHMHERHTGDTKKLWAFKRFRYAWRPVAILCGKGRKSRRY